MAVQVNDLLLLEINTQGKKLIPIKEFYKECKARRINDDDGYAIPVMEQNGKYYFNEGEDEDLDPSFAALGGAPKWATHVIWIEE